MDYDYGKKISFPGPRPKSPMQTLEEAGEAFERIAQISVERILYDFLLKYQDEKDSSGSLSH